MQQRRKKSLTDEQQVQEDIELHNVNTIESNTVANDNKSGVHLRTVTIKVNIVSLCVYVSLTVCVYTMMGHQCLFAQNILYISILYNHHLVFVNKYYVLGNEIVIVGFKFRRRSYDSTVCIDIPYITVQI